MLVTWTTASDHGLISCCSAVFVGVSVPCFIQLSTEISTAYFQGSCCVRAGAQGFSPSLQCVLPQVMSNNEWALSAACRDACGRFVYAIVVSDMCKNVV